METVGVIGTGEIGARMARRLAAAGYRVIGYDCRPAALAPLRDSIAIADSVGDLARRSDVVITCVTDGAALADVIDSPQGLAQTLAPSQTVIDTTSGEPWITRALAPKLAARGIPFLDAPVSGGVPAAETGRMNFMVGGDPAILDRWRNLLLRLGTVITHVGATGAGHTVKAVNMIALAASMLATAEVLAVGRRAGFTWDCLLDRLNNGPGGSYSTRVHFPRFIAPGNYGSGFSFDLMRKDLSIALGLADRCSVPLFLGRTTWELYSVAANSGFAGKDNTRIVKLIGDFASRRRAKSRVALIPILERVVAMANLVVAVEAVRLGEAAGLTQETVIKVLAAGSGDSFALSQRLPLYRRGRRDRGVPLSGTVNAGLKFLGAAGTLAVPTLLTGQAIALHTAALRLDRHASDRKVVALLDGWIGKGGMT